MKKKIQWAYVGDMLEKVALRNNKRIFVADLGDEFDYRYACVDSADEVKYLQEDGKVDVALWRYAELIKESEYGPFEEGDIEDIKKLVGKVLIVKKSGTLYTPHGFYNQDYLNQLFEGFTFEDGSPVGKLREE